MSDHTIRRIANVLDTQFANLIDMSDWTGRPEADQRRCFLQRALAALCLKTLAKVDHPTAANAITDGYQDCGIDGLLFDQKSDTFFLIQAKWNDSGNKPLDPDSMSSFVTGAKDLLAGRLDRFNAKTKAKEAEIKTVLYSDRPIRIRFITTHTASQKSPLFAKRKLDDFINELNDPVECARHEEFDQAGVYGLITGESTPPEIKLQIVLNDWGVVERPYLAYYGKVHVKDISGWWANHGNSLFTENLRLFYTNSAVNNAVRETLDTKPENFWYYNNGITIICKEISKSLAGSPARQVGLFNCEGVSIVNGAQTVGTIGHYGDIIADDGDDGAQSFVQVRIISLAACPPEFARAITRAANLQNAVGYREFAAMDPTQQRIATDFTLDRRKYVYKSGENDPRGDEGCSIVEATQAMGCAHSAALAVQVKREIGTIWASTDTSPYTDLFNDETIATRLWQDVLIMRTVDETLQPLRATAAPRADMICVHLNRIILHLCFKDKDVALGRSKADDLDGLLRDVRNAAQSIFLKVTEYVQRVHEQEYLASLCKNIRKCEALVEELSRRDNERKEYNQVAFDFGKS